MSVLTGSWWAAYGAALLAIGFFDALWLGWLAIGFYQREIGDLMAPQVRWVPALLFYLGYPAGLVSLALVPAVPDAAQAIARSALVGLLAYATYDLSNMATLRHWSWKLALVDIAWGSFISACAGWVAWRVMRAVQGA